MRNSRLHGDTPVAPIPAPITASSQHKQRDRFGVAQSEQNPKIDSRLLAVVEGIRRGGIPVTPPTEQSHLVQIVGADAQGRIRVYVKFLEWSEENLAAVESAGAFKIEVANQSLMTVLGSIPSGQIEAVAALSFGKGNTAPLGLRAYRRQSHPG